MEHLVYGFVTPTTLETLGISPDLDRLEIVAADARFDEDRLRRIAFDIKALIESTGRRVYDVSVPKPGRHIHAEQMDSLLYVQGAFGVLALVLSGALVVNLMSAILAGQVREIGVMKAVGASTGQVAGIYLALALVLGLTATALALPVAGWIGRAYAGFAAGMLNFDITEYKPHLGVVWLQLATGVLLPVVSAMLPVFRGAKVTVSQALRDYGIQNGTFGNGVTDRMLGRVSGPTRPMLLSLRNTFRRRLRLVLTLLSLAMGGAIFLAALNLRTSIRQTVAQTFDAMNYQAVIQFARPYPFDDIKGVLGEIPGVVSVEAWVSAPASLTYPDGTQGNAFLMTGPESRTELVDFPLLEGRWLEPGDTHALVVNNQLIDQEPGVGVGNQVTLAMNGEESVWSVVGLVQSSPSMPIAYANRDDLASALGHPERANRAVIVTAAAGVADQAETMQQAEQALDRAGLEVSSSQLVQNARAVMEDHLLMVASFLLVMSLLILLVGGLGLATTMSIAVLERTREIGVMRAIGAAHRTIQHIILAEGLIIGILSWMIAVPLSLPMSYVVGKGFGQIMFQTPVVSTAAPLSLAIWLAIVLFLSTVASVYPALKATRQTTAEALSYG